MNRKELYETLSDEVKEKIKACRSDEQMLQILREEKIELSPELLDSVAGGEPGPCITYECDKCHENTDGCYCN